MSQTKDMAKLRRYPLFKFGLLQMFRTGHEARFEVVEGFPADAFIVRHHFDQEAGVYWLTVWSDSFEPVKLGDLIPFGQIVVRALPAPVASPVLAET